MKLEIAKQIRARQLQGLPVDPQMAAAALTTIQGSVRRRAPRCPCGDGACEAEPAAVVAQLKPWALLTPKDEPQQPERYPWPMLGVDIDAVHRSRA